MDPNAADMACNYLETPIEETRRTETPHYGMAADGYTLRSGAPTSRMVRLSGEKRWRRLTRQARRDTQKLLRRLDKALEPTPKARSGAASGSGSRPASRSRARSGSRMRLIRRRAKR